MPPAIRAATAADLDAIIALHAETLAYFADIAPEGFAAALRQPADMQALHGTFSEALDDEDSQLLVAELDGRLAGYVMGFVERYSDDLIEAPYLSIVYLAATPEARGQGVARTLVDALLERARQLGLSVAELRVWEGNAPAQTLYEQLGFKALERRMALRL
jgi:ribosomal protein S18 acetylase RimI-like enzyme